MVEECITGIKLDLAEYLELYSNEIMRTCKREILGDIVDRGETDASLIHGNVLQCCIVEEATEPNNANGVEVEVGNEPSPTGINNPSSNALATATATDDRNNQHINQVFNFTSNMLTTMFKLNNIGSTDDWRKNDLAAQEKDIFKDIVKNYEEVAETFESIFLLITIHF